MRTRPAVTGKNHTSKKVDSNYYGVLLEGTFFFVAMALSSSATALPAFARELGASPMIIGLTPALVNIGWLLPQILGAGYVTKLTEYKPFVLKISFIQRILWLLLGILCLCSGNTLLLLSSFLFTVLFSNILDGISTPPCMDIVARVIPQERRGSLFATRTLLSGLLGLGCGRLTEVTLSALEFPANFGILFIWTFFAFFISWFLFRQLITEPPAATGPETTGRQNSLLQGIGDVIRNKNFFSFICAKSMLLLGTMATAFFVVTAGERLHLPVHYTGRFTVFVIGGQILTPLFCGRLADRYGHKINLFLAAATAAAAACLPLFPANINLFRGAFLLTGSSLAFTYTSRIPIIMELAPPEHRVFYCGVTNTLLAPATLLAPIVGGWLAETFSYNAAFTGALLANGLALFLFAFLVPNPRKEHWA